jgi:L-alanine-DL-glutamate epimerase-like enolase superfamily enzyme
VHIERGFADALDRPGLGVEVDEDLVQRHRLFASA